MKNFLFLFSSFFIFLLSFSQNCPVLSYSYDAAGNRIKRELIITLCNYAPPPPSSLRTIQNTSAPSTDTVTASKMKVKVYPNPALDKINVEITQTEPREAKTIFLFDLNGKIIYTKTTSQTQIQINVAGLVTGLYYLNIIQGKNTVTYSVLKK